MKRILLLLLIMVSTCMAVTDYYIDAVEGNDDSNGFSWTFAKQTIQPLACPDPNYYKGDDPEADPVWTQGDIIHLKADQEHDGFIMRGRAGGNAYIPLTDILGATRDTNDIGAYAYVTSSDTDPPTPNPSTFETVPTVRSDTSIVMIATTASDDTPPIYYLFTCTTDSNFSSGWQASTIYISTGLTPETEYTFTVTSGDSVPNTSAASDPNSATTNATPSSSSGVRVYRGRYNQGIRKRYN